MFGGGGGGEAVKKKEHPKKLCEDIAAGAITEADFAGSSIYAIKPHDWTEKLCAALVGNTTLKKLNLQDCQINDDDSAMLGAMLATNKHIAILVLNKNKIRDGGCIELANGLRTNCTLREIELFQQEGGRKWGEGCLTTWLDMYKTNVSILRVNWATNSKSTITLTKMLARNMEINGALKAGQNWHHLYPGDDPPPLEFYQMEDVKKKRGGAAAVGAGVDRSVAQGKVLRNGVADVVAAPGSVQARLAAMRGDSGGAPAPAPKKLWEPEPAPAPAPAPKAAPAPTPAPAAAADTVIASYTCLMKSQIRSGFPMDSDKAGVLSKNVVIDAFEERVNETGTTRVRFAEGWVSMKTGKGDIVLQPVGGAPASAPAPDPSMAAAAPTDDPQVMMDFAKDGIVMATLTAEGGSCTYERLFEAAEEHHCDVLAAAVMSLKRAKKISYEGMMLLMPGAKDVVITIGDGPSPAAAAAAQDKAAAAAREQAAAAQAKRDAADAADAAAREAKAVAEAEAKAKAASAAKVKAEAEAAAKQRLAAAAEAEAAEAKARAERQAAADAEAAATAVPNTVIASYTCLMKSQIRSGFPMDSDKAGVLAKQAVIDAFEERVNETGTTRVRFAEGWVSMKTGKGDIVLQPVGGAPAPARPLTPKAAAAPAADPVFDRVAELKEVGMQHFANREFAESIAVLKEAASLDPNDEEVTEAMAFAQTAETKYKLDQSAKLQERAMEFFTDRDFDSAVDALTRALAYTPGDEEILEALEYAKTQTAVE